jgi:glutamate N-acetyltransferase/amino-acid N-acetyltransferase
VRVPGFRFSGVACGLKKSGKRDLALIVSDVPARVAGSFTTNLVKAAPIVVGQKRVAGGWAQAVLVNSGNANAYTGRNGIAVARSLTRRAARLLKIEEDLVIPSSTGRIGCALPHRLVSAGIDEAVTRLSTASSAHALEGMMTTDAFAKFASRRVAVDGHRVTVAGLAKGAGMIAPNMATMLAYILTDADVSRQALQRALKEALPESFNAIVVDGDMSTNDTVLLLANGVAKNRTITARSSGYAVVAAAVSEVARDLARMIVRDGEGGTKVVDIFVRGARSARDAERVADAIARSPLCKTAFHGGDPYAGRLVCAAGYAGARFDPHKIDVFLDKVQIVRKGIEVVDKVQRRAAAIVRLNEFSVVLDLHAGHGRAHRIASDLSVDYVRFNSDYRT